MDKLAVSPAEAARLIDWTERGIYQSMAEGNLRSFKLGKRRLIRIEDLKAFIDRQALLASQPVGPKVSRKTASSRRPTRAAGNGSAIVPFPEFE